MFENPLDDEHPDITSGENSGSKNKQKEDQFTYSIRNRTKKEAKDKMTLMEKFANDIDKPKGPKETW